MIDFTKAFDTNDHVILLHKLSQLSLLGFVINWICSFLSGRGQQSKVNGLLSNVIDIGLSIVQGSGIGPTMYIVMKNDLCTVSAVNDIFQYADDIDTEFQNVKAWAANNCLKLNLSKTKEIIFKLPRVQYFHMPPAPDDVEQLDCCKLLGVIFQSNFKMDWHIEFILSQCAQHMYLLKLLCHQVLSDVQLSVVAYVVIISRLLYALPAWGGFFVYRTCQQD